MGYKNMVMDCPVCGFSKKGDQPPQECPVCGTSGKRFTSGKPDGEGVSSVSAGQDKAAQSTGRWKCSVCGYTRSGSRPEERCPVCGTSGERFIALSDSSGAAGQDQAKQPLPQKPPPETATRNVNGAALCAVISTPDRNLQKNARYAAQIAVYLLK